MGKKSARGEVEVIADDKGVPDVGKEEQTIPKDPGDPEIKGLYDKFKKKRLHLQPSFQRNFVWDAKKASGLIESAIIGLPLPIFYFAEEKDRSVSVIDGQQRLTSFFSFIDGKFPSGKPFKLTNLKVYRDLNKKSFGDLPDHIQEKIMEFKVRTVTFLKEADPNLKFLMFERLNSGAVSLKPQEMRNCVYHGPYNELLRKLSVDKDYKRLMEIDEPHPRMVDVELVLRFAAFYFQPYMRYRPPIKKFLDDEMLERRNMSNEQQEELKDAFKKACSLSYSLLGEYAFLRFISGNEEKPNGHWESTFNVSLYDIVMGEFARRDKNLVMDNLSVIKDALIQLMITDDEFIDSITKSTSSAKNVKLRFDKWRMALDKILENKQKEPRCFSYAFKKRLYDKDPTCKICDNEIVHIDDAAVDHIKQYGQGGKTSSDNARLTHRYCNNARSRKE